MFVKIVIKVACVTELKEEGMRWISNRPGLCYFKSFLNLSGHFWLSMGGLGSARFKARTNKE